MLVWSAACSTAICFLASSKSLASLLESIVCCIVLVVSCNSAMHRLSSSLDSFPSVFRSTSCSLPSFSLSSSLCRSEWLVSRDWRLGEQPWVGAGGIAPRIGKQADESSRSVGETVWSSAVPQVHLFLQLAGNAAMALGRGVYWCP